MNLKLKVWRQAKGSEKGCLEEYDAKDVSPDMSFLEMIDVVNQGLVAKGVEPIAFDSDCREGICGMCSLVIDGVAHGSEKGTATCQLHMRKFKDGQTLTIEPWRAKAFPVVKDLVVDRSAFDRVIQAGGYVSVNTGSAAEANSILIGKDIADTAMDAAACIGCGACVAQCKNASAMLFVAAKASQLAVLPQGQVERHRRALSMVAQMDAEGFGSCTNQYECEAVCPKQISVTHIARLFREHLGSALGSACQNRKAKGA